MTITPTFFFKKKINNNKYLIYNSIKHIPLFFDEKGIEYINLIRKYKTIEECKKNISDDEFEDFGLFYDEIINLDFFSLKEDEISLIRNEIPEGKIKFFIHITNNCNLSCEYCYNEKMRIDSNNLNLEQWLAILDKIMPYYNEIVITGGEPTLFKDLNLVIEKIKKDKPQCKLVLFSNANTNFNSDKLKSSFTLVDELHISCDGLKENKQLRKGFSKSLFKTNIQWLINNGFSSKIFLNAVYSKGNRDNLESLINFANKNFLKYSTSIRIPKDITDIDNTPSPHSLNNLQKTKKLSNIRINSEGFPKVFSCSAAYATYSIDALGNCYPCQSFHYKPYKLGNILKEDFKNIYFSDVAIKLRNDNIISKKEVCLKCNLKYACGGGCPADTYKLHGDILKHPSFMCKYYKIGVINRLKNLEY